MRLTRLYAPNENLTAERTVDLNADQSHYLLRVLRLANGDPVVLFNETSGGWQGIVSVAGKKASVALQEQIQQPQPVQDVWLLVSPLKKEAWDFCLEKATELGVGAIGAVMMDYTQNARVNDERARVNMIEAAQQCERTHVPTFFPPVSLERLLDGWDKERVLFVALERSDAQSAAKVFAETKTDKAALLIGPEGGFSPRERDILLSRNFVRPVSLGQTVLRAETAALAALSVYLLRD